MTDITRKVFTAAFTDAYGVRHDDAQCFISNVSRNDNLYFDEAGTAGTNATCHYNVSYWHDAAAKDAGLRTMSFVTNAGVTQFYLDSTFGADIDAVLEAAKQDFLAKLPAAK